MEQRTTWGDILRAVTAAAVGLLAIALIWMLVTVWTLVGEIRETQKGSRSLLDVITDCTDPEGECYKRSRAETAQAIGSINISQVAAVSCGLKYPDATFAELLECVGKKLDEAQEGTP